MGLSSTNTTLSAAIFHVFRILPADFDLAALLAAHKEAARDFA